MTAELLNHSPVKEEMFLNHTGQHLLLPPTYSIWDSQEKTMYSSAIASCDYTVFC
jgi:hypothetical protein